MKEYKNKETIKNIDIKIYIKIPYLLNMTFYLILFIQIFKSLFQLQYFIFDHFFYKLIILVINIKLII